MIRKLDYVQDSIKKLKRSLSKEKSLDKLRNSKESRMNRRGSGVSEKPPCYQSGVKDGFNSKKMSIMTESLKKENILLRQKIEEKNLEFEKIEDQFASLVAGAAVAQQDSSPILKHQPFAEVGSAPQMANLWLGLSNNSSKFRSRKCSVPEFEQIRILQQENNTLSKKAEESVREKNQKNFSKTLQKTLSSSINFCLTIRFLLKDKHESLLVENNFNFFESLFGCKMLL